MAAPLMPSPKGFESGRLDDPSSMLTYHARQGLGHGSSLISALSEEDKAQLAEELTISGWRSHSPMLQSALAKALGHRQSMLSASQMTTEDVDGMLDSNSALLWNSVEHEHDVHADSSELSQQIGTQQRGGDWSLTQQDIAVMEQSWREPRTRQSAGEAEREEEAVRSLARAHPPMTVLLHRPSWLNAPPASRARAACR